MDLPAPPLGACLYTTPAMVINSMTFAGASFCLGEFRESLLSCYGVPYHLPPPPSQFPCGGNIINTNKEGQEYPTSELVSCLFVLFSFSRFRPCPCRLVLTLAPSDSLPEKVHHGYSFCNRTLPQVLPFLFRNLEIRCPAALILRPS